MVRYWDEDDQREFIYLTNAKQISALLKLQIVQNRWQVELFSKMAQAAPKIKKFRTSENAVKIQVYSAIIAYCLILPSCGMIWN